MYFIICILVLGFALLKQYCSHAAGLRYFSVLIVIVELLFGQNFHFHLESSFSFLLIIFLLIFVCNFSSICISRLLFYSMPIYSNNASCSMELFQALNDTNGFSQVSTNAKKYSLVLFGVCKNVF